MAILIDVSQGQRLKLLARGGNSHGAPGEASPAISVIDVDPPALKRRDQVQVTVVIEIGDNQGPTRHDRSRARLGKRRMDRPVPLPITEIHLDAISIPEQDEVQMAVAVEI